MQLWSRPRPLALQTSWALSYDLHFFRLLKLMVITIGITIANGTTPMLMIHDPPSPQPFLPLHYNPSTKPPTKIQKWWCKGVVLAVMGCVNDTTYTMPRRGSVAQCNLVGSRLGKGGAAQYNLHESWLRNGGARRQCLMLEGSATWFMRLGEWEVV